MPKPAIASRPSIFRVIERRKPFAVHARKKETMHSMNISRRKFLGLAAFATAGVIVPVSLSGCDNGDKAAPHSDTASEMGDVESSDEAIDFAKDQIYASYDVTARPDLPVSYYTCNWNAPGDDADGAIVVSDIAVTGPDDVELTLSDGSGKIDAKRLMLSGETHDDWFKDDWTVAMFVAKTNDEGKTTNENGEPLADSELSWHEVSGFCDMSEQLNEWTGEADLNGMGSFEAHNYAPLQGVGSYDGTMYREGVDGTPTETDPWTINQVDPMSLSDFGATLSKQGDGWQSVATYNAKLTDSTAVKCTETFELSDAMLGWQEVGFEFSE